MKLDYGTQLSFEPIPLSIGTLRKPKLIDIAKLGFDKFSLFEAFLKMTPERFYEYVKGESGKKEWNSFSEKKKEKITMYSLILGDEGLRNMYVDIFNFFFEEQVIFKDGLFVLLKEASDNYDEILLENVRGVIHENSFCEATELIQQICCIYEEKQTTEGMKFKNNAAKKIYEKILKAQKAEKAQKKSDINLSLPNIISAVSNAHPTISPINVWDLTIFVLLDSFNRLQVGKVFDIESRRVSVWGDEKKTFNIALWYKNEYDRNKQLI